MTPINLTEQAYDLLLPQYKDFKSFVGQINAVIGPMQDIENQGNALMREFDLDSDDADLDAIGELIGLPRPSLNILGKVFQFDVTAWELNYPFGDNLANVYTPIPDELYVRALKSWIITNNSTGNTNDLIKALSYIFDCDYSQITITEDITSVTMTLAITPDYVSLQLYDYVKYNISQNLFPALKSGSQLFPKIAGIQYNLVY